MQDLILFLIKQGKQGNNVVLVYSFDREDAKQQARQWLGGNADQYTVTPLTNPGNRIHLAITLFA